MSGMPLEERLWRGRFSSAVGRWGVLLKNIVTKRKFFSLLENGGMPFENHL